MRPSRCSVRYAFRAPDLVRRGGALPRHLLKETGPPAPRCTSPGAGCTLSARALPELPKALAMLLAPMNGLKGGAARGFAWLAALLIGAALAPAVALGSSAFTFVPDPAEPSLPSGSDLLGVAELAGNGIPDLVIVNAERNAVGVMLGNGAGGFGAPTWYSVGGNPGVISVADFNNDGHPDIIVPLETAPPPTPLGNPLPDHVEILFGNGQGNFTAGPLIKLPEIGPVSVGDFTGGGNQDVLVAPDGCWGGANGNKYYMLLGDGHGDLTPGPVYESPRGGGCRYFVGDFTGDGRDDVLTQTGGPGQEEAIDVVPGNPDGTLGPAIVTPTPQLAHSGSFVSAVGDLQGNGVLDLAVRTFGEPMGRVEVFDGNGDGGFSEVASYPSEQSGRFDFEVALGAFAGGGHLDMATIGSRLSVLANNGAGVFSTALTAPLGTTFNSVFVADVNRDGRPDLILGWPSEVHIFLDEPPSPASPPPMHAQVPLPAPVVENARESARRWREGGRLATLSGRKGPQVGTAFSFSLNEPASVGFSFTEHIRGRQVGRKCLAKNRLNAGRKECERAVRAGTLSFAGHSGRDKVLFQGVLSRRTKLGSGTYTLSIRAANSAGTSAPVSLGFTIVN